MPLKRKGQVPADIKPDEGGFGLKNLLAGAVRAGTGVLSGISALSGGVTFGAGNLIGAGVAGAGEGAAQMIEEGDISAPFSEQGAKRMAVEAGLGAVPLGKLFKMGRFGKSFLTGGAFSGAGETMREMAREEELSPGNIAVAAGTGGLITGGLAKLFGKTVKPSVTPSQVQPAEVVPTSATGAGTATLSGGRITRGRGATPDKIIGARRVEGVRAPTALSIDSSEVDRLVAGAKAAQAEREAADVLLGPEAAFDRVPLIGTPASASGRVAKIIGQEEAAAEKAVQERLAADEILAAKERLGEDMEIIETIGESYSSPVPGGKGRLARTFRKKKDDGSEPDLDDLGVGPTVPATGPPAAPVASPLARVLGVARRGRKPKTVDEFNAAVQAAIPEAPPTALGVPVEPPILPASPEVPPVAPIVPEAPVAPPAGGRLASLEQPDDLERLMDDIYGADRAADPLALPSARGTMPAEAADPLDIWMRRPDAPVEPIEAAAEEAPSALARFFKGPADVLGQAYRDAKADPDVNPLALRQLGIASAKAAQEAGIPSQARPVGPEQLRKFLTRDISPQISVLYGEATPPVRTIDELAAALGREPVTPPVAPLAQQAAEEAPDWIKQEMEFLDRIKKLGSDETGMINPALLSKLALGAGGALAGAAIDPLDDPLASAALGGAAGVAGPSVISSLARFGVNPQATERMISTEGIKNTVKRVYETLPHLQRFNYLANPYGIVANALAGPWGSAMMASVEHTLTGDPRGMAALRLLTPDNWFREFRAAIPEAGRLIARGESRWVEGGMDVISATDKVLTTPGHAMTAGDLASRNILEMAGFSAAEARQITLTSEPFSRIGRAMVNISKTGPLGQLSLPFSRTPANIGEQGAMRIPGLGSIVQSTRDNPDPPNVQAIQQLLGVGAGAAGYAVGANIDPESSRNIRRFATNLGGQYSLPTAMGFAAGQAVQRGQPAITGPIQQAGDILPLPTFQPITEWAKFITGQGSLPQGAVPSMVRPYILDEQPRASLGTIGRRSGLRRKP